MLHAIIILLGFASALPAAELDTARLKSHLPELEKTLHQNIAAFWLPRSIDTNNGGYIINFGPNGEPKGEGTKAIVTQSRQVWLFSRMARGGHGDRKKLLEAAEHGYRFLREKMWDPKNGGFYWEVDASGDQKLKPNKHLYGQSFGLYAISEYAMASGRKDVLDFAISFFRLLEEKSHDKKYGGYIESFLPDWTPQPASERGYMGDSTLKLMNTHLHLLEAMTTFYRASKLPLARERLLELILIESNSVVRKGLIACTDKYDRDWTPRLEGQYARVSYGHDLENIWLLMDANDAAGVPNQPLLDLYRSLFAYSMKYGYDSENGGFYDSGPFNQPADNRTKVWWVASEAIVSALYMYRMTGDAQYLSVFEKTWDFVKKHHIDWANGEWHANVLPNGQVRGDKANVWKAGYHNGRAMIECLELIRALDAAR
jgi:mannobiose 2-epimerase